MQKKNWFVRVFVILLILFVASIIVTSFFFSENKFIITAPIICLVTILVILALAEIFDNFSIGNFLSLKKEYKRVEHDLIKTEQDNRELRLQLTNIVASINSNHNTTILGGDAKLMERILRVEKAPEEEVQKKKQEEEHISASSEENNSYTRIDFGMRRHVFSKIEDFALSEYCKKYDIISSDVLREMKFSEGFVDYDPIMERNVIFDAYYKAPWQEEIFIEICNYYLSPTMLDRFYHLLSKVYYYRTAKKLQAKLVLIIPAISEEKSNELSYRMRGITKERFCEYFAPAIKNNLLELVEVNISDVEIDKIKKQVMQSK